MAMDKSQAINVLTHHFESGMASEDDAKRALNHKYRQIRALGAEHTRDSTAIHKLIDDNNEHVRKNINLTSEHVDKLVDKNNKFINNTLLTHNPKVLSTHHITKIYSSIDHNTELGKDTLEYIAEHPKVSKDIHEELSNHPHPYIERAARHNPTHGEERYRKPYYRIF